MYSSYNEADVACSHLPQLTSVDLSPLLAFPPHPLPLLCRLCTSSGLLLSVHVPDHHFFPVRCWCLMSRWFACCQAKNLLFHAGYSPTMYWCLRSDVACCTALDGIHFRPVSVGVGGIALFTVWSVFWSPSMSSEISLLEHLYSSVRLMRVSSRSPSPWRAMLLRHLRGHLVISSHMQ